MKELLIGLFPNVYELFGDLLMSIVQTLVMVSISGVFGMLLGTFLGIVLVVTREGSLYDYRIFNMVLDKVINTLRSIPFVILIALMVSFTRFLVGTSIGVRGAIVPMVAGIIPLVSRTTEQALLEIDNGVIEAARAMGLSRFYIIAHVLLPEALPGLMRSLITSFISLIGLSAMAGTVGGGGIGNFAVRYGYSRYMNDITVVTVLLLLLIVNIVQNAGSKIARKLTH
ncbi:MAG: methionine ABC transporter permease [Peptococcaceae bacterium]|nr:methionine ABC transporter permease [Peptococcaceae bacterium]